MELVKITLEGQELSLINNIMISVRFGGRNLPIFISICFISKFLFLLSLLMKRIMVFTFYDNFIVLHM